MKTIIETENFTKYLKVVWKVFLFLTFWMICGIVWQDVWGITRWNIVMGFFGACGFYQWTKLTFNPQRR